MLSHLFRARSHCAKTYSGKKPEVLSFQPRLEECEDRTVPNASTAASGLFTLNVLSTQLLNGSLTATGDVDGNHHVSFTSQINISTTPPTVTGGVPSVQLSLSPITVNQRAISFSTSAIDLSLTPTAGTTGSFGSVLANVATELNSGMTLSAVLAGLSATDSATLMSGLSAMINGSLADLTADGSVTSASGKPGKFGTLGLSFESSNLMVDGQTVTVNNGTSGAVTATVTAGAAQGHLLDNLFHKLGAVITSGNTSAEAHLLAQITQRIDLIEGIKVG